eukprot:1104638-Pyramimonas_sp.AAC.1
MHGVSRHASWSQKFGLQAEVAADGQEGRAEATGSALFAEAPLWIASWGPPKRFTWLWGAFWRPRGDTRS